jgi:hypothetical protein
MTIMAAPVGLAFAVPVTRRVAIGWFWCSITKYRLRVFFREVQVTNWSGKTPRLIWVRRTPVGERALCYLVAGLSIEHLAGRTEAIASACWAQKARVTRIRRFASLAWIDVTRRDPLTRTTITSPLVTEPTALGRLYRFPGRTTDATPMPRLAVEGDQAP